jgi:hypothetical protein
MTCKSNRFIANGGLFSVNLDSRIFNFVITNKPEGLRHTIDETGCQNIEQKNITSCASNTKIRSAGFSFVKRRILIQQFHVFLGKQKTLCQKTKDFFAINRKNKSTPTPVTQMSTF